MGDFGTPFALRRLVPLLKKGGPVNIKVVITLPNASAPITLRLKGERFLIGRQQADVIVDDPSCSRLHALLSESTNGELRLRDLGSRFGTLVNGEKITDAFVIAGDEIKIGRAILLVLECPGEEGTSEELVCHTWPNLLGCVPQVGRHRFVSHR